MNKFKTIVLTLFLAIGFTMPGCGPTDSCDGVVFLNYFDVKGISTLSYTNFSSQESILGSDTITFSELDRIHIDYDVSYHASVQPKRDWSFSLISTADACSYLPGGKGSKEEMLVSFSITTLNDFDADHLANSDISDLFDYHGSIWNRLENPIPLIQFLEEQTENLREEDMLLELKKAPEIDKEFKLKVKMELSTGEVFEFETYPFFITS